MGPCGLNRALSSYPSPGARICKFCQRQTRRRSTRNTHLLKHYEITLAEYDALLAAQGGVCAGCGQKRSYNLSVDHCHATERTLGVRASVRGLLCRRCNKVLRDIRDDAETLRRLADYLTHPPARSYLTI